LEFLPSPRLKVMWSIMGQSRYLLVAAPTLKCSVQQLPLCNKTVVSQDDLFALAVAATPPSSYFNPLSVSLKRQHYASAVATVMRGARLNSAYYILIYIMGVSWTTILVITSTGGGMRSLTWRRGRRGKFQHHPSSPLPV